MGDRFEISVETRDLNGGPPTVLLTRPLLHDFYWLSDGRVFYSIGEGGAKASDNCNLWEVRVNAATGAPVEQPRRLTNWAGFDIDDLSATSDGKRLVFQKWSKHVNVHIGELQDRNTNLTPPQKLTLSQALNFPTAWTSDSKAVIFLSDRNGHWGIYKQKLNRESPETLVTSDTYLVARTSPDGRWILYFSIANIIAPGSGGSTPLLLIPVSSCAFPSRVAHRSRCSRPVCMVRPGVPALPQHCALLQSRRRMLRSLCSLHSTLFAGKGTNWLGLPLTRMRATATGVCRQTARESGS